MPHSSGVGDLGEQGQQARSGRCGGGDDHIVAGEDSIPRGDISRGSIVRQKDNTVDGILDQTVDTLSEWFGEFPVTVNSGLICGSATVPNKPATAFGPTICRRPEPSALMTYSPAVRVWTLRRR